MSSRPAHPEAMAPPKKGVTRTAPPQMPSTWWSAPRIRAYLLFGATGFVYFIAGALFLSLVWDLGDGPQAWMEGLQALSNPVWIIFNALTLVSVIFVGVRAFGGMMPKMQPRTGPLPVLPAGVVKTVIYSAWALVTLVLSLILSGVLF